MVDESQQGRGNVQQFFKPLLCYNFLWLYRRNYRDVKRFCNLMDLLLTSRIVIVRHFIRWARNSAQSLIGQNIADIRHRYEVYAFDINVNHVGLHRQCRFSQEPFSAYSNYCITS